MVSPHSVEQPEKALSQHDLTGTKDGDYQREKPFNLRSGFQLPD